MRSRSPRLPAAAEAKPTLPPTTLLKVVFDGYLEAVKLVLKPSTYQPRKSHLNVLLQRLDAKLQADARKAKRPARCATLTDITKNNIEAVIKELRTDHVYDARGKAIGARAVATWLAESRKWYVGDERLPVPVLYQLAIPPMKAKGREGFSDHELATIREAANAHPTRPYLHLAAQYLGELGVRSGFEVMTLRLADVHLSARPGRRGSIAIREENTKTDAGPREIPLEPEVSLGCVGYLTMERPAYTGDDPENEPFFLNTHGLPFTYSGWNSMRRRFKKLLAQFDPSLDYKASRNRSTRTKKLRALDYQDSAIMQLMGWSDPTMIARYAGKIPLERLEKMPGTVMTLSLPHLRRAG